MKDNWLKTYFGILFQELKRLNKQDAVLRGTLFRITSVLEFAYSHNISEHGPFTVFAPTDEAFANSLSTKQV